MAGGNYGGSSIPTQPIVGTVLVAGKDAQYKHYACTSALATHATNSTITYRGVVMPLAEGHTLDLVFNPPDVTVATSIVLTCYDCSWHSPMTGTTAPSSFYSGTTDEFIRPAMFQPTIIGGGGLNS